ncbi:APC family permease [Paracoccus aminophilus]|uniref:Amino acid transporter n=1 Tax=Paracoccus aminophilus JCM 7686 TaxID=1367847 RepID=S5XZA7_PARAH|nr:APC family permease [Paracoccus aminophilus]AGT10617.1 amino acid transporter [Paracoccus aminophilus JCM 7686]
MAPSDHIPRRSLHSPDIFFMVVAAAAPLAAVVGNGALGTLLGNGAGMPGAYLIAGLVLILFAIGFVKMSPYVKSGGAFYAYIRQGLGGFAGGAAAYVALLVYLVMVVGSVAGMGFFCNIFLAEVFGLDVSWKLISILCLIVTGVVGYREITLGARLLAILLSLEIVVLLVLALAVFSPGSGAEVSLTSFSPATVFSGNFGVAIMFAFVSFLGFESAAIYSEEARDGTRTVARALIAAVLFIAIFYAISMWSVVSAFGPDKVAAAAAENPGTLVYRAFGLFTPGIFVMLAEALMVTSALAATIALHNAAARYVLALSRERMLPAGLGRLHDRMGSPHLASLTVSVITGLIVLGFILGDADPLMTVLSASFGLAALGIAILQAVTSAAVMTFFLRRGRDTGQKPLDLAIASVATLCLAAIAVLILSNYAVLTGSLGLLDYAPWLIPLAAVLGALLHGPGRRDTGEAR